MNKNKFQNQFFYFFLYFLDLAPTSNCAYKMEQIDVHIFWKYLIFSEKIKD